MRAKILPYDGQVVYCGLNTASELFLISTTCLFLIEAYSQYIQHHSDLLTLKSLNFLPYDFGRIWAYIF